VWWAARVGALEFFFLYFCSGVFFSFFGGFFWRGLSGFLRLVIGYLRCVWGFSRDHPRLSSQGSGQVGEFHPRLPAEGKKVVRRGFLIVPYLQGLIGLCMLYL
jgi:hypothetical protein